MPACKKCKNSHLVCCGEVHLCEHAHFFPIRNSTFITTSTFFMTKIEHIGIAVADLPNAIALYETLLNTACYKTETVESEGVETAFFATGPNKIELVADAGQPGTIAKFIEKKGAGIHHIAFAVDDIEAEMARLKALGFVLLSDAPKHGADNKLVCFLHPKNTMGVLVELCQEKNDPTSNAKGIV
jgi:methylmalonyl-CoA/ethylmalonyl-CoA epimerase